MNYAAIKKYDIANGPGVRVSLFVSGCRNHCKGCFNKETWDFNYGQQYTTQTMLDILDAMNKPYISGISILGGDPLQPQNIDTIHKLFCSIKRWIQSPVKKKTIWLYTGYNFQDFMDHPIMKYVDVVVDGKYEEDKRDLTLAFRGSSNQRIIDVQRSLKQDKVILVEEYN